MKPLDICLFFSRARKSWLVQVGRMELRSCPSEEYIPLPLVSEGQGVVMFLITN